MRTYCVSLLFFVITFPILGQQPKIVVPITAGDLKQLCKSFELVQLEVELGKQVNSDEVTRGYACLNFIMGVLSTVGALDVGYFPKLKYEIVDSHKPLPHKAYVSLFMKCVAEHPEYEKESAAAIVALALMEAKILLPKSWVKDDK